MPFLKKKWKFDFWQKSDPRWAWFVGPQPLPPSWKPSSSPSELWRRRLQSDWKRARPSRTNEYWSSRPIYLDFRNLILGISYIKFLKKNGFHLYPSTIEEEFIYWDLKNLPHLEPRYPPRQRRGSQRKASTDKRNSRCAEGELKFVDFFSKFCDRFQKVFSLLETPKGSPFTSTCWVSIRQSSKLNWN